MSFCNTLLSMANDEDKATSINSTDSTLDCPSPGVPSSKSQKSSNLKLDHNTNEDPDGQSVTDSSNEIVRRSARKSFAVPSSYSVKDTLQSKDAEDLNENLKRSMEDPFLMSSKDELDETSLQKNNIKLQLLTPTVKPKNTPRQKKRDKENNSPIPEINPMIFEGNFPSLKLHRIDERLPLLGAKGYISTVVPSAENTNAYRGNDEHQDDKTVNGDAESVHGFKVDGTRSKQKKTQLPILVNKESSADEEDCKERTLTVSEIVGVAVRQAKKKMKLEFRRELQQLIDKYGLPETAEEEEVESPTTNSRDSTPNNRKKKGYRHRNL